LALARHNLSLAIDAANNVVTRIAENPRLREADFDALRKELLALVVPMYEEFVQQRSNDADLEAERGKAYYRLAFVRHQLGEAQAAIGDSERMRQIFARLAAKFPNRPEFRQELAGSHNDLGILLRDTGRFKEAESAYGEALAIRKQLAAEFPNVPDYQNDVAGALVNQAILAARRREFAVARKLLDEALPYSQAALGANPRHPSYRQYYRSYLKARIKVCANLGDRIAAFEAANTVRDLGWDPDHDVYNAARLLAQCVPIVEKDDKLDSDKRQAEALSYADAAMAMLRDAISKGYKDAPYMKKDTDLDPLRQREDFQMLVKELEEKR
jgi:tetratricopeptide (TPR) repeat protein